MLNDITVIIRSAGENTTELCKYLVLKEVQEENVFIIAEKPFSTAVKKTIQKGIEQNKKWTLAIDADLIIMPNSISKMIDSARKYEDRLYVYQGYILDKFKCSLKYGGPHLYLTKNLQKTIRFWDKIDEELRPESYLYRQMHNIGYRVTIEKKLFALHDFFQHYQDIYRKAYFHGIKHKKWRRLLPKWIERGSSDFDYRVFAAGYIEGYYAVPDKYPSVDYLAEKFNKYTVSLSHTLVNKDIQTITKVEIFDIVSQYSILTNDSLVIEEKPKRKILTRLKRIINELTNK